MLLARCGHDRRQVAAGGEPAWLITAAPARSARGRGRTPPARSGRVADPMDSHVQAAAGAGGPPNPQAEPLEARLTCSENTWARTTQPNSCRGPRTPGHIPGIATPIHLPSTADTPSMYFSWTAQRRDPPRAGIHRPGSVAGGSPRTGDRASCAWPTARRPSASLSLCRVADGLADQSTYFCPWRRPALVSSSRASVSYMEARVRSTTAVRGQLSEKVLACARYRSASARSCFPPLFRVAHGEFSSVIQPCSEVPFDPFVLHLFKRLSSWTIRPAQPRPGLALQPGADRPAGPAAGRPDRRADDAA